MSAPARFPAQLHRLKTALSVHEDRQVAAALGMTPTALALRKRRDAFPEEQVIELAASRPDLDLDVVYIVTGAKPSGLARLMRNDVERLELARMEADLRASRDACLAKLGDSAAKMSLSSLRTLAEVAERIATADSHDDLSAPGYVPPPSTSAPGDNIDSAAPNKRKGRVAKS